MLDSTYCVLQERRSVSTEDTSWRELRWIIQTIFTIIPPKSPVVARQSDIEIEDRRDSIITQLSEYQDFICLRLNLKDWSLEDNLQESEPATDRDDTLKGPTTGLGILGLLPLELVHILLGYLDIHTLVNVRRANRYALRLVASHHPYKALSTYARKVIPSILSINAGHWLSCQEVYKKLCIAECEECGDFGGYLYILTCKRVCFLCLSDKRQFLPLRYSHAMKKFGVDRQILRSLPQMRSIPGVYSPNSKKSRERIALVDFASAYAAGVTYHGSPSAMERSISQSLAKERHCTDQSASQKFASTSRTGTRRRRQVEEAHDGRSGNPFRFMAVVRMPWLNRLSNEVEWGFHCIGCQRCSRARPLHFRRKFTASSFKAHLQQAGSIRDGKHTMAWTSQYF